MTGFLAVGTDFHHFQYILEWVPEELEIQTNFQAMAASKTLVVFYASSTKAVACFRKHSQSRMREMEEGDLTKTLQEEFVRCGARDKPERETS